VFDTKLNILKALRTTQFYLHSCCIYCIHDWI